MLKVSHIINSIFSSRTYILSTDKNTDFWLVDCGDIPSLIDTLKSLGNGTFKVKGVLLTHAHYDHMYGLPELNQLFPEIKIYTNEFGKSALANERLNFSKYHEDPIIYESENVIVCDEGSEIELFDNLFAKVFYTPGHNPSCLTYEVGDFLFTGDAFIPGVSVVSFLKGGDKKMAVESLAKLQDLAIGKIVCPGHEVKYLSNDYLR